MTKAAVEEHKLSHVKIREAHASIESMSPLSPHEDNGNTWPKMYLSLATMPQELRAYLVTLHYTDLPYTVLDDCLLDILVQGDKSPVCAHLQRFWIEYHRHLWGAPGGQNMLGKAVVSGDYAQVGLGYMPGASPMMRELKISLLREMSDGAPSPIRARLPTTDSPNNSD